MKIMEVLNWQEFKTLVDTKKLLPQYSETSRDYELYAPEDSSFLWHISLLKDENSDVVDFETNYKSSYNKPLEYRSNDGFKKVANAKFSETSGFWVDGTNGLASVDSETTSYLKTHFPTSFSLSGVDVTWDGANWGDCLNLTVGYYTDLQDESTFTPLASFSNCYRIYKCGSRYFDVATIKLVPSTVTIDSNTYDVYIRTRIENNGPNASKVCVNLVGWK